MFPFDDVIMVGELFDVHTAKAHINMGKKKECEQA